MENSQPEKYAGSKKKSFKKQFLDSLSKSSISDRKQRFFKNIILQDSPSEIEVVNKKDIFTDDETSEQLYSEDRNFYINHMLEVIHLDDSTFKITNFTPTDFGKVTVLMQLSDTGEQLPLGYVKELKRHSQLVCNYPFIKGERHYKTDQDRVIVLGPNTRLADTPPIFDVYTDHRVFEKLQQIKVNWHMRFFYKNNQHRAPVTPKYARAYTALIPEIACIVSSDEYKDSFIQGNFGLWVEPNDKTNEDGSDKIIPFSPKELEKIYETGMKFHVYRLGLHENDGGVYGTGNCKNNFARVAIVKNLFALESDQIFETFGHEYGHAICTPNGYPTHETNIPHDFYKGNGGCFSKIYRKFVDSDRLPFSQPGVTPNLMMGFGDQPADAALPRGMLPCVLDEIDETTDDLQEFLGSNPSKQSQDIVVNQTLVQAMAANQDEENLLSSLSLSSPIPLTGPASSSIQPITTTQPELR